MATDSERRREIIVGLFALIALAIAAFMVIRLGAEQRIFEPRFNLRAVFGGVSGLRAGAPVFVAGLAVGTVERLRFVPPGTGRRAEPEGIVKAKPREGRVGEIEVLVNVEERFRPEIRLDSVATIGSVGLLGDKSIEISVGSASEPEIEPGGVLLTVDPLSLSDVIDQVEPMARKVDQILGDIAVLTGEMTNEDSSLMASMNSLSEILQKIDRGEGSLGQLVNSPKTVDQLDRALNNADEVLVSAQDALAEIRKAAKDVPPTMASIRQVAEEVATLSVSLRESATQLPGITRDIAVVTDNLKTASQNFPTLSVEAERGMRQAGQVFDAAGRSILLRGYMDKTPSHLPSAMGQTAPSLENLRQGTGEPLRAP